LICFAEVKPAKLLRTQKLKRTQLLMTFGLILIIVGLIIAFAANMSMDPAASSQEVLLSALGRVATGIAFQLLGLGLIIIGKK
jgi:hypothetical protein